MDMKIFYKKIPFIRWTITNDNNWEYAKANPPRKCFKFLLWFIKWN
jgi:hypothetical protein